MSGPEDHFVKAFREALAHHQSGRLTQAEQGYRKILASDPRHADALHHLGVIAHQVGKHDVAVSLMSQAASIAPAAAVCNNLGEALRALGRFDDARGAYQRALQLDPRHVDSWTNLGLLAMQQGQHSQAVAAWSRAAQMLPNRPLAHDRLGTAQFLAGDYYGAVASHRRSVSLDPDNARGHSLLGAALAKVGKPAEAMPHVRRAVEREPNNGPMHNNLGYVLQVAGQFDEALAEYDQAIALGPQQANMFANRASCLDQLGRLPDAVEAAEKGAAAFPNDPNFPSNISVLCRRLRDYPTAIRWAERALKIQPGMSDAHGNLALALLSAGDYARGWVEYEWRWRSPTFTSPARDFRQPLWDGSDAAGRTILVHAEQGFGDTIQFMRYVPMLIERGAKVIVECHYALLPMVRRIEGLHKTVAAGLALPDFDVHAPLLSLPRAFGTTLDSIPSTVPYLTIDAQRIKAWREKIPRERFNVGITWAGNRKPDPSRNISPELLLPLRDVAGIRLFGLQKRDAETYSPPPPELEMVDLSSELSDFAETGSAMRAMDLVLTIDSAAAHLAGAIGAKVWTFVPWAPDWRWMLDRDDSPWYPTMRLFRQTTAGDWPSVIRRVVDELRKISSA